MTTNTEQEQEFIVCFFKMESKHKFGTDHDCGVTDLSYDQCGAGCEWKGKCDTCGMDTLICPNSEFPSLILCINPDCPVDK